MIGHFSLGGGDEEVEDSWLHRGSGVGEEEEEMGSGVGEQGVMWKS